MSLGNAVQGFAFGVLNELIGLIRDSNGISKPSRYEVILLPPAGGRATTGTSANPFASIMQQNTGDGTAREVSLKVESISMPGRNIDTAPDTNIYGPTREIAQGFSFADIDATIQLSSDLRERKFIETWQRLSFNPVTWSMGYYDDYTGAIQIYQLDENDERRYGVELIECFPKNISAQAYDYSNINAQSKMSVSFSYRYWKNLTDENRLPISLQGRLNQLAVNTIERQLTSRIPAVVSRLF